MHYVFFIIKISVKIIVLDYNNITTYLKTETIALFLWILFTHVIRIILKKFNLINHYFPWIF